MTQHATPEVLEPADPGIAGPDSVTWQIHADPAMWLAGIRGLYLQALHPRAVAGVLQNSDFRTNPIGRLLRTADYVGVTTYGSTEEAEAIAARVRRVHAALRGTDPDTGEEFRVDEPELLRWIHCAEVASFLSVVHRSGYPLRRGHADRYFAEQREAARLVGLDPATVPGSVDEMTRYFSAVRPRLRRSEDADVIYEFLHRPPVTGLLRLGVGVYEASAGHLAYSLLPSWAIGLYGRRAYPRPITTAALRAVCRVGRGLPRSPLDGRNGPHVSAAVRRLGREVSPSPRRLPPL